MSERSLSEILEDAPSNWGKWGDDDEIGALNYLTPAEVLRGVRAVEHGKTFTLGLPIGHEAGDPVSASRREADHHMAVDKGHYEAGKFTRSDTGGLEYADDVIYTFTHGSTHVDALGHAWYDDTLYNGFDAATTKGGLEFDSIEPVADHGMCGRAVLLDVARHRGVDHLGRDEQITLAELRACADAQGVELERHDVLLVRTGWLSVFYEEGREAFYGEDGYREPGITCTEEILEFFHEMEIPVLATDTISNEQYVSDETGTAIPLHGALLRDQGVLFNELVTLDELAADCADDGKYDGLYVASPLKIVGGVGSPVNPVVIK